nr:M20/M25/M40 family metallo-hydrolase [Clostridia bacterium]
MTENRINSIKSRVGSFAETHIDEAEDLLRELGRIPAPTRYEEKRAEFIRDWLIRQGAENVRIDSMKNVIWEAGTGDHEDVIIWAAHMDVVQPDTEAYPMSEEGRILRAPGIGDDTANLVNLLMGAKYLIENRPALDCGFVICANSCEEGLGNLDGSKELMRQYEGRVRAFYSFDCYLGQCIDRAVGSHRYRITVNVQGGHSWSNFGRASAIKIMADLIEELYGIPLPEDAPGDKTTFNVGVIRGGTTVNSIPQKAEILYEYRSTSEESLSYMKGEMEKVIDGFRDRCDVEVELLGVRPGNGDLDAAKLKEFTGLSDDVIGQYYDEPVWHGAASTDSNIPLSKGIPANTIGTVKGSLAHT